MQPSQPGVRCGVLFVAVFLASMAVAIVITNDPINPVAGEPYVITWQNAEGPVTIMLIYGEPHELFIVGQIVANLDPEEGTYTWDVPEDLVPREDYALTLDDGVGDNYSVPFALEGTGDPEDSTSVSSAAGRTSIITRTITTSRPRAETDPAGTATSEQSANSAASSISSTDTEETSEVPIRSNGGGNDGGGSDTTTIVGIAVGVGFGVIGMIGLLGGYWFYRKSKQNKVVNEGEGGPQSSPPEQAGAARGDTKSAAEFATAPELGGNPVSEMQSPVHRHEMDAGKGGTMPVELSAGDAGSRR